MKYQDMLQRFDRNDPMLLLAFLQYALDDVRALSERSGRHPELAISTLADDTSGVDAAGTPRSLRQRS